VGDSRCYRLRDGHFELLTKDHSLLTEVLEQRPDVDDSVLMALPQNVVTRALGMDDRVRVSIRSLAVVERDRYLLCSDGLSAVVDASLIAKALSEAADPQTAVTRLIELANRAGGPDNIAAVVIDCRGGHEQALPASARGYAPPRAAEVQDEADPELLILGIEEIDTRGRLDGDDLIRAVGELLGKRQR
jgi:serine/threonine protein phosphatase PrpC